VTTNYRLDIGEILFQIQN